MELFKIFGTIAIKSDEAEEGMASAKKEAKETASSMERSFDKIGKAAEKTGKVVLKMGKVIATGLAAGATAVGALAKTAIDSYAEYEQLVGGSQLMFGEAYDFIADKAANAYKNVQMSQNDYLRQVNGFATGLKTALGGDSKAAAELADRIITAEADIVAATGNSQEAVQNAFNGIMKSNFTMLDNLQLGITPTKEGFQEVIDKVNEWNKANGEATKYQIDNLADCQSALLDYVEMQGLAGYAAKEAAGTIQGSLSMLKASWHNLLTGMADDEADFDSLINNFVESAGLAAENLLPRIEKALDGTAKLVDKLAPVIVERIPSFINKYLPKLTKSAVSIVQSLVSGIKENSDSISETILEVGGIIGTALVEMLPMIFEIGVDLLVSLATGIAENIDSIVEAIQEVTSKILATLTEPGTMSSLSDAAFTIITTLVAGLFEALPELTGAAIDLVIEFVNSLTNGDNAGKNEGAGVEMVESVAKGIGETLGVIAGKAGELVATIVQAILNTNWLEVGWAIVTGISEGLAAGIPGWTEGWDAVAMAQNGASVDQIASNFAPTSSTSGTTGGAAKPWIQGSHASGLDYVPFDGYIAELHRGEMVVPAGEASMLRGGSGSTMVQQMERMIELWTQFMPEALSAMKTPMVCDTNGLAIAMAPTMDTELGRLAIKKGRGR